MPDNTVNTTTMTFHTRWRNESHRWHPDGEKITSPENLEKIYDVLEHTGSIVIEHWFYCGASAPDRRVFDTYDEFIEYLHEHAHAGDDIHVWSLHDLIHEHNRLVHGKCPAEDGCVPEGGAY